MIAEGRKITASEMHDEIMTIVNDWGMPMDPLFLEFMHDIEEEAKVNEVAGIQLSTLEMMFKRAIDYRTLTKEA